MLDIHSGTILHWSDTFRIKATDAKGSMFRGFSELPILSFVTLHKQISCTSILSSQFYTDTNIPTPLQTYPARLTSRMGRPLPTRQVQRPSGMTKKLLPTASYSAWRTKRRSLYTRSLMETAGGSAMRRHMRKGTTNLAPFL